MKRNPQWQVAYVCQVGSKENLLNVKNDYYDYRKSKSTEENEFGS